MFRAVLVLVLSLCAALPASAATVTTDLVVDVAVDDDGDGQVGPGEVRAGVPVVVRGGGNGAVTGLTDADGRAVLQVPAGSYDVTVSVDEAPVSAAMYDPDGPATTTTVLQVPAPLAGPLTFLIGQPTGTATPTPTPAATATPTASPTATPAPTATPTPASTATPTPSPTPTGTPEAAQPVTLTATSSALDATSAEISVTVTNATSGPLADVAVTLAIPAGLQVTGGTTSVGTLTVDTGIWEVGTLAADGTATVRLQVTVLDPADTDVRATATTGGTATGAEAAVTVQPAAPSGNSPTLADTGLADGHTATAVTLLAVGLALAAVQLRRRRS